MNTEFEYEKAKRAADQYRVLEEQTDKHESNRIALIKARELAAEAGKRYQETINKPEALENADLLEKTFRDWRRAARDIEQNIAPKGSTLEQYAHDYSKTAAGLVDALKLELEHQRGLQKDPDVAASFKASDDELAKLQKAITKLEKIVATEGTGKDKDGEALRTPAEDAALWDQKRKAELEKLEQESTAPTSSKPKFQQMGKLGKIIAQAPEELRHECGVEFKKDASIDVTPESYEKIRTLLGKMKTMNDQEIDQASKAAADSVSDNELTMRWDAMTSFLRGGKLESPIKKRFTDAIQRGSEITDASMELLALRRELQPVKTYDGNTMVRHTVVFNVNRNEAEITEIRETKMTSQQTQELANIRQRDSEREADQKRRAGLSPEERKMEDVQRRIEAAKFRIEERKNELYQDIFTQKDEKHAKLKELMNAITKAQGDNNKQVEEKLTAQLQQYYNDDPLCKKYAQHRDTAVAELKQLSGQATAKANGIKHDNNFTAYNGALPGNPKDTPSLQSLSEGRYHS